MTMAPVGIRSAALGALLVVLSACVDSDVVAPDLDLAAPSMAILDGSTGGSGDFFFPEPLLTLPG